jgi:hypothetical protein
VLGLRGRSAPTAGWLGRLFAEVDITDLIRFRREIVLTLVVVNGCLTLAFALGGYFALRRMLQPFGVLSRHMEQIRDGCVEPIPDCQHIRVSSEFGQLFERYNAMAQALNERQMMQSELADQDKVRDAWAARIGNGAAFVGHEGGASDVANPGKPAFKEIERRLEHCRVIAM